MPRRWTAEHLVAGVEAVCGVVVVVWLAVLGDGAPALLALGLVVGIGLWVAAVRRWRWAARAPAPPSPPSAPPPSGPPPSAPPPQTAGPPPLSPEGERELARVVAVLGDSGVYAPRVPDPADLRGPVADRGEPVTAFAALAALHEAGYYAPGFDAAAHQGNLAFHDSHGEQFVEVVEGHVDDLRRLARNGLDDVRATIELVERPHAPRVATRVRLAGGDVEQELTYDGAHKYLSTVVHVAVALILRERRTGVRLAWLWGDQGVWVTALPDGADRPDDAVERLNAALGPAAEEGFEWVDEGESIAAGDVYP